MFALRALFSAADAAEPPRASLQWRNEVIRTAREIWGLTPPLLILPGNYIRNPAGRLTRFLRLARRVWRNYACNGKMGKPVVPALRENKPFNPAWAIRALVQYDHQTLERPGREG
ncbi:lytic murein transglycosylase [Salmonella enterica subsp. enterica]|uniref:Lytic murein transglycosylase n=1 Tax=Salmonella enterica I TaxID=59201 RepID=A0A379X384_SALET|nr:lytic murein transglycosylase [Salmonella enterica subsp. enterica]